MTHFFFRAIGNVGKTMVTTATISRRAVTIAVLLKASRARESTSGRFICNCACKSGARRRLSYGRISTEDWPVIAASQRGKSARAAVRAFNDLFFFIFVEVTPRWLDLTNTRLVRPDKKGYPDATARVPVIIRRFSKRRKERTNPDRLYKYIKIYMCNKWRPDAEIVRTEIVGCNGARIDAFQTRFASKANRPTSRPLSVRWCRRVYLFSI